MSNCRPRPRQPKAAQWLSQLTQASAARHGQITIFIDSGGGIQIARDRARRRLG